MQNELKGEVKMKEKDKKTEVIQIRVNASEKVLLQKLASDEDLSMGRFIMKLVREHQKRVENPLENRIFIR